MISVRSYLSQLLFSDFVPVFDLHYYFRKSSGWGIKCCSSDNLFNPAKNYIVDGYLTINLNGILMAEKDQHIMVKLTPELAIAADSKDENKDFIIAVGEKEIKVHKKVLAEASPVFAGMLESEMKEAIENKMEIPDFTFEIVEAAIQLCYGYFVPIKSSFEKMSLLYKFGDKYQIKLIIDAVQEYLISKLSPANVCQAIEFSKTFHITKLHQACTDYLMKCSKNGIPVYGADALDKDLQGRYQR